MGTYICLAQTAFIHTFESAVVWTHIEVLSTCWAESVVDSLALGSADFVAFLNRITR